MLIPMIERLLGIIYILMNKGTVTAAELAERFEVSVRTIYRDIESLSIAGIPVYSRKGKNGGISLTEEFVLNKLLITKEEQQEILAALVSLQETELGSEKAVLQKLGEFFKTEPVPWVEIDLSDWSGTRKQMYEDIKQAILKRRVISFDYYGQNRPMSRRTVEPVQLLFKEYTWYLKAYCRERQDFRTFKIFHIQRLEVLEESFIPKTPVAEETTQNKSQAGQVQEFPVTPLTVWIDKKEAYRIYDRFDETELEVLEDGNFLVHCAYPLDEWVYSLVLSFGASAKVLEPEHIRLEIQKRINKMMENYEMF